MSSKTKKKSETEGRKFVREAFAAEQDVLATMLKYASTSVTHEGKKGEVTENHFLDHLTRYLPKRYRAESAIVIDSDGKTSDQIDVVIYDPQYTPVLLDQKSHKYVPAEAVYAVIEVKPEINAAYLEYAGKKAKSVRKLKRTSIPITWLGGNNVAKTPFPIVAGLVASKASWKDGMGKSFLNNHSQLKGDKKLDCVLALNDGAFDIFHTDGKGCFSPKGNALVFFVFRLLQKLQSLGTVPAIDWNAYANQLSDD
jgi:hypothetical protein